jgi:hypothetical protein
MLLFLHSSSRHLRMPLIVGSLLVGLARQCVCADLPMPTLVSAASTCTSATLTWSNSGNASYFLMVFMNGSPVAFQSVTGTTFTLDGLTPGNYTVMIQAVALSPTDTSSAFSAPLPFMVSCGPVCIAPVITLAQPNPAVLCHGHPREVPVVFSGSIATLCPLASAQYTLIDSFGSPSQAPVTVAVDGSFAVTLTLAVDPPWRRYTFSVQAANSVGSTTSAPLVLGIQKGCNKGDDNDHDDGHFRHLRHDHSDRD